MITLEDVGTSVDFEFVVRNMFFFVCVHVRCV